MLPANLTVTPAPLTITANGVSRIYGASDPALGVSYSGFVNGETSSVLGGTLSVADAMRPRRPEWAPTPV